MSKKRKKVGAAPGSVVFTGNKKLDNIQIHRVQYDIDFYEESVFQNELNHTFQDTERMDWYDVCGLHDTSIIESMGKTLDIHPLALEDIVSPSQRPKFEEYESGNFLVIQAVQFDKTNNILSFEQVSIYFKKSLVLSFQETESDLFKEVRNRLKNSNGRIRQRGSDYLTYAILDAVVDYYHFVLDEIELTIISLEGQISFNADMASKGQIHNLKKELFKFRRIISPLREALANFIRSESNLVQEDTLFFLRDVQDHATQVLDSIDSYRDQLNGLQDLLNSEVSNKMNQTIHLLTLVSTIFIPLTFLAGIYGMNFDNMPELHNENGYFYLLAVMLGVFLCLLSYFKRKKWL